MTTKNPSNAVFAAEKGHLNVCKYIIENTEDKNSRNSGYTPLHLAAENGRLDVCKYIFINVSECLSNK